MVRDIAENEAADSNVPMKRMISRSFFFADIHIIPKEDDKRDFVPANIEEQG